MARPSDLCRWYPLAGAARQVAARPAHAEVLAAIEARVAGQETTEQVLEFVFDATAALSPCDRIAIAFLEDGGRRLVTHAVCARYEPVVLGVGSAGSLGEGSLAEVLAGERLRVIDDLELWAQERRCSAATRALVREGVRSSIACPLFVEGRQIGVLFRSARAPGAYGEEHALLHGAIAHRLAQAVEKTWRIEQLRAAQRSYDEMLAFVSHELRSPVANLVTNAETLSAEFLGPLNEQQRAALERMARRGRELLTLVNDYLELSRLESGALRLVPRPDVRLGDEVVRPALDWIEDDRRREQVATTVAVEPPDATACVDPDLLRVCLVNLLGNAIKYGERGGAVRLRVVVDGEWLSVEVWNTGPGFAPDERGRLFGKFSRLRSRGATQKRGTGVGLYSVWRIVELHGGQVDATSELGAWALFSFRVPVGPSSPAAERWRTMQSAALGPATALVPSATRGERAASVLDDGRPPP